MLLWACDVIGRCVKSHLFTRRPLYHLLLLLLLLLAAPPAVVQSNQSYAMAPPGECPWGNEHQHTPPKSMFFASPFFLPLTLRTSSSTITPSPTHIPSYHIRFHPFASFCRKCTAGQTDGQTDGPKSLCCCCCCCCWCCVLCTEELIVCINWLHQLHSTHQHFILITHSRYTTPPCCRHVIAAIFMTSSPVQVGQYIRHFLMWSTRAAYRAQ